MMTMKIINATPHQISFHHANGKVDTFEPSGILPRVSQIRTENGTLAGYRTTINQFGEVENLPHPEEGVFYIVSAITRQAAYSRTDLLMVDDTIRNEKGHIVGCKAFSR